MITRLRMPLPNVNMPCPLLFWLVIIALFHCRASSLAQYTLVNPLIPTPTHAVTSPGLNCFERQYLSHRHSVHRFTSTVFTSYHTFVCTLCLEFIISRPETCSFNMSDIKNAFRRKHKKLLSDDSTTVNKE